jgi:ring-1,2-phenylacetyl-CoA epoxidase subunit PaaD
MVTGAASIDAADAPAADVAARADARALAALWRALGTVVDPEIPMVSIVELGIVRGVARESDGWVVTVTPTYSGCPATRVIESDIRTATALVTDGAVRIVTALAPAWTTDWIAPEARRKLREAGIAPPHPTADADAARVRPIALHRRRETVRSPRCGSARTEELAHFGSTACKAQYRCRDCLEPFDYFKPH